MTLVLGLLLCSFMIGLLAYNYASLAVWSLTSIFIFLLLCKITGISGFLFALLATIFSAIFIVLNIKPLRCMLVSCHVLRFFKAVKPEMSRTEQEAIAAGTVDWEGDLFTGHPDWEKLLAIQPAKLTAEEQAFLDGPTETLCNMIDDWHFTHELSDLSPQVWDYIKSQGFLGLIIPKIYGGKEFSAWGHAAVLIKLHSRSIGVASTVTVPNSLGPAELLLTYGTEEQKNYYLPRLATGEEIPCFALTAPTAGSDAAAITDSGIVCRGQFSGREVIGIKLNWNKRYITLAPVATVLGLAFRLYDPEKLLSEVVDRGITCALIPTKTAGITIGRRHFPLNSCFMNGPTQGRDVFIPADWIIGGAAMAGHGWQMLMECLGAGRGISLPAGAVGGGKAAAAIVGAYARIRKQFNVAIGLFEGIEEPLSRIAGLTYINEAALRFVASAVDNGAKPAVASAIVKYHTTENSRIVTNDAMDVQGGKAICLGPRNTLGRGYQAVPIAITVEGANILTRSLIIFGQGAIRCHPYVVAEMEAANSNDLARFDQALFSHLGFIVSNKLRTIFLALTSGRFVSAPEGPTKKYFQLMTRYSSALAFMSEVSMLVLGANLKRREKLTARLGDALSMLYLGSAVLKRFHDDGQPADDLPLVDWCCRHVLHKTETALYGVIRNFPQRLVMWGLLAVVFPLGRRLREPTDKAGHKVAQLLLAPSAVRDRLVQGIHVSQTPGNPIGQITAVLAEVIRLEPVEKRMAQAIKAGVLTSLDYATNIHAAAAQQLLTEQEKMDLLALEQARAEIIAVDDFDHQELSRLG